MSDASSRWAAAKAVPIATLVGEIQGAVDPRYTSRNTTYYRTALGKLQVSPGRTEDRWHFWSGPAAGQAGGGAIDFAVAAGLAANPREAVERLWPLVGVEPLPASRSADRPAAQSPKAFRPPRPTYDRAANWAAIRDYLCGVRRLPPEIVRPLVEGPRPAIYAGHGDQKGEWSDGHYLVFPVYEPSVYTGRPTDTPMVGAILRWRHPGDPPEGVPKAPKRGSGASQRGWWQVGPYPAPTLIVTEAPIDALSLWAALPAEARQTTRILATGGSDTPKAPGVWTGVERLICAQDRDPTGDQQAHAVAVAARMAGLAGMDRLTPDHAKDWNAVWMAAPDVVRRALHTILVPEAALGRSR